MTIQSCAKLAGAVVTLGALVFAAMSIKTPRAQADDDDTEARVKIGFKIAPVPLHLDGKDRDMVGLGSYLVNAIGDCNGCHTAGGHPNFDYAPGRNPYFNQPLRSIRRST